MEERIGFFILRFVDIKVLDSAFDYVVVAFVVLVPLAVFLAHNLWLKRVQETAADHSAGRGKTTARIFRLLAGFPFIGKYF